LVQLGVLTTLYFSVSISVKLSFASSAPGGSFLRWPEEVEGVSLRTKGRILDDPAPIARCQGLAYELGFSLSPPSGSVLQLQNLKSQ